MCRLSRKVASPNGTVLSEDLPLGKRRRSLRPSHLETIPVVRLASN